MSDPSYNRNPGTVTGTYAQSVYAFLASGGFVLERGFSPIKKYESVAPEHIDVTDSVQIMLDVATFNAKLGTFDAVSDSFSNNSITISSADLISGLTKGGQVFSAGKYSTLYSDFTNYVSSYFGYVGGFSSLFEGASEFAIDGSNNFTGASFVRLLNGETVDASGQYISNLSGAVTISDITMLLRYVVDANVFGNRDPAIKNWGMADGFVEGDLIWVPAGTTITLKVGIDSEKYTPINNIGPSYTQNTDYATTNFSSSTVATTTLITRTVTAPLLIKLVSSSTIASLPADTVYPSNGDTTGGTTDGTTGGSTGGTTGGSTGGTTGGSTETTPTTPTVPAEPIVPVSMSNFILLGTTTSGTSYITSPDATWTLDGSTSALKSAASSGSNYYAVGTPAQGGTSTVVKSLDGGVTWRLALKSPFATSGNDVLIIGNTMVACGSGGNTLAYVVGATDTPQGNTWTTVNTGLTSGTQLFHDAAASKLYVVGSGSNTMSFASSPSGTWTGLGKYVFADEATTIHGPAFYTNPKTWVAVGQGGTALTYGTSGTEFTANVTSPLTSAATVAHGADANGVPVWVAGGQGSNTLAFSRNPSAGWTGLGAVALSTSCKSVAYGVDASGTHVWVAAGAGATNTLAFSKNPISAAGWSGLGKTLFTTGYSVACGKDASGNALWMAAGAGTAHTLAFSRNPTVAGSWTGLGKPMFSTVGFSIAYGQDCSGNPIWVAAGQDDAGANNALAYSRDPTDPTKWYGLGSTALSVGQGVAFGTDGSGSPIWLAVGSGVSTVAYSRNPTSANAWTGISTGLPSSSGYSVSYGVDAAGQALWVVGQLTTNTVIYSNFPTVAGSWAKPTTNMFTIMGGGFAQERMSKYIAGGTGRNGLMGSLDGQTWYPLKSPFTIATHDVYWSQEQQLWVAVGEGTHTLAHSTNGIEWEGHGLSVFSIRGKKVSYSAADGKWYATGEGTYVAASSTDGHEWIPTGTTTPLPVPINADNLVLLGTTSTGTSSAAPLNSYVMSEDNTASTINTIAFDGTSTYYAGGTGPNNLVQSTDGGAIWYPVASPFTTSVTDIVFAGSNTVVAAGTGTNTLAYNAGSGWAPINNGQTSVSQLYYDAAAPLLFSAGVGANTLSIASSASGTWTGLGTYVFNGGVNTIHGPCNPAGGRLWVAGGNGGNSLATSGNIAAGTWTGLLTTTFSTTTNGIAYGTDASGTPVWVAVGSGTTNTMAYSYTPSTSWTGLGLIFGLGSAVSYGIDGSGNAVWVAVGGGANKMACSTNPVLAASWTYISIASMATGINSVEYGKDASGNPLWIACGNGTNFLAYSYYPTVASSWIPLTISFFTTQTFCVKYGTDCSGNPIWMAGGTSTSTSTLAYSRNPTVASSWVGLGNTMFGSAVRTLEFGTDASGAPIWLAGGSGTTHNMAYSYNPTVTASWTGLGKTTMTTGCTKISYGVDPAGKSFWTAAGTGTNKIAYSTNPVAAANWLVHNTTFSTSGNAIAQERIPKYIAGGNGIDNMSGSIDGQTWFDIKSPFSSATNDVFWSPQQNLWVAVGEGGNTVAYSSNGITWTGLGTTVFGLYGKNITFSASENKWYASGYSLIGGLATATSSDGITWTTTATTLSDGATEPVIATNYTLLGSSSTPLTAPTAALTFDKYSSTINTVTVDTTTNTTYAGASGAVTLATSTDGGSTWTAIASPFSTGTNDIVVAGSQVVAAGSGGNAVALYDGTSWTAVNAGLTTGKNVFYDASASRVYAMGTGANTFAYSSTPVTTTGWKGLKTYVFANGVNTMHGPANYTSGRLWVAGGTGGSNTIAYSGNGTSWTGVGSSLFTFFGYACAYGIDSSNNLLYVAGGASTNTLAFSGNGISWTGLGSNRFLTAVNSIKYGMDSSRNNLWVAGGQGGNTLAYSYNPSVNTSWNTLGTSLFNTICRTVEYGRTTNGNPLWLSGGQGGNTLAYSNNGISWNNITSTPFSTYCNSIKYGMDSSGNSLWMAVGSGTTDTMAYSTDGITWYGLGITLFPSSCRTINFGTDANGNPLWIAGGEGTLATMAFSRNPTNINSWVQFYPNGASYTCNSIEYSVNDNGQCLWIAVFDTNKFYYSNDPTYNLTKPTTTGYVGTSWYPIATNIFSTNGYFIFSNNIPKFIAGGTGLDNMRGSIDGQTWYYIKSPFSTATNDVCWSQQQQLWVAVGEGGNTLAYSSNGIKWTGIGPLFSTRGNKVMYDVSENMWYAVGDGMQTIYKSSYGKYWVKYPVSNSYPNIMLLGSASKSFAKTNSISPYNITWTGQNLFSLYGECIAYDGSSTYYAGGEGGATTLYKSTDEGNTWTAVTSPFSVTCKDVIYAGSQLVACGSGTNTLAYYNGTTWTSVNNLMTTRGLRLFYEPSIPRLYAMGIGGNTMSFASSASGTWTGLGTYVFPTNTRTMHGPAKYLNRRLWVAGGNTTTTLGYTYTPTNDNSWTITGQSIMSSSSMPNSCIKHGTDGSGNELWVATGGSTNGANTIAYSYDGINWNVAKGTQFYSQGLGLDYGADQSGNIVWLAGGWSSGQTNTLAYSKDGITWTSLGSPGAFVVYGIAFGYTATGVPLWIACGDGSKYAYSSNPTVLASWTTVTDTKMTTWRKMLYSNTSNGSPLWVAVGTGTNSIAYSTSGISGWTGIGTQIFTTANSVDYGIDGSKNLIWWAGGTSTGNTIATSSDGINWIGRGKLTITGTGFGTGYGLDLSDNPILMTVGNGSSNGVSHVYSYYGTTWTVVHKASFSVAIYSIAQQRIPKYISGGTGTINMKGSLDGQTWYYIPSPFTLATYDVYWSQSQQLWVAVGEGTNTVAYSSNGLTWTGLGTTIFSIRGRKVTFSNTQNMWFIAGEGTNTLAASYDGKSWMPITSTAGYVDQIGAGLYVK